MLNTEESTPEKSFDWNNFQLIIHATFRNSDLKVNIEINWYPINNTISEVQSRSHPPKNDNNDMWVARLSIPIKLSSEMLSSRFTIHPPKQRQELADNKKWESFKPFAEAVGQRHAIKVSGSCPSKLDSKMFLLCFGIYPYWHFFCHGVLDTSVWEAVTFYRNRWISLR